LLARRTGPAGDGGWRRALAADFDLVAGGRGSASSTGSIGVAPATWPGGGEPSAVKSDFSCASVRAGSAAVFPGRAGGVFE
jgi:hypothetical protein